MSQTWHNGGTPRHKCGTVVVRLLCAWACHVLAEVSPWRASKLSALGAVCVLIGKSELSNSYTAESKKGQAQGGCVSNCDLHSVDHSH